MVEGKLAIFCQLNFWESEVKVLLQKQKQKNNKGTGIITTNRVKKRMKRSPETLHLKIFWTDYTSNVIFLCTIKVSDL